MARKFVSGVLAFAMVFGATAPVVFAEPVATEVVDQEANYLPSFEKSEVTVKKGDTVIVKVNDIGDDVANVLLVKAGSNKQDDNGVTSSWYDVTYIPASKSIMITNKDGLADDDTTFKFKLVPVKGGFTNNYSTEYISLDLANPNPTAKTLEGWSGSFDLTAGKSTTKTLSYKGGSVPSSVSVKLTTLASEYVSVSTSDKIVDGKKVGVNVTLTGLKSTDSLDKDDKAKIRASLTVDGKTHDDVTLTVGPASNAAAVTLKANATKITTKGEVSLVAQAYKTDDYGNLTTDDDNKIKLVWSINGVEGATYTDSKGNTLATLTGDKGIMTFKATTAGTYTVTVADEAGTHNATREITVTSAATPDSVYVATSTTDLTATTASTTVKPGATVDLSAMNYAVVDTEGNKALLSAFSGYKATYELEKPTKDKKYLASYNVTTGNYTLVAADDADMAKAVADGKILEIPVTVTFTKSGAKTLTMKYTIKVTKAGAEAASITVTDGANFKAIAGKGNNQSGTITNQNEHYTSYVMSAGTTVNFNAVAKDTNEFTDVSQDMIWYVENTYSNDTTTKPETIAVNNGGKLTALTENAGKVSFVGVSASNPNLKVYIQLYITAAKPTATPTATATPAPTATTAPTAAPTTAPATKTGKVTASSLRVRETPVNGTVVGKLAKGTAVTILETKDGWYKVTAGSLTGWVSGEYVELTTPSTTETATTTANLKLRKTAKTGSVITTMPKGSKVEVLEKGSEWSKVKYNGKTGYASNAYLEFEEDAVG